MYKLDSVETKVEIAVAICIRLYVDEHIDRDWLPLNSAKLTAKAMLIPGEVSRDDWVQAMLDVSFWNGYDDYEEEYIEYERIEIASTVDLILDKVKRNENIPIYL